MTNLERWQFYCKDFPTTDNYVDFSYLFMVSAALQRRVWLFDHRKPIWPNQYILFVAPPGVGKSMVTDEVKRIFKGIPYSNKGASVEDNIERESKLAAPKMLVPMSADSTSFESFVQCTAKNMRFARQANGDLFIHPNGKKYSHCSSAFFLDEVTSIFHKEAENIVTFLLSGWSCTEHYERTTISRNTDFIRNLCVNLIGGTQPDKLAKISRAEIIGNGFMRRVLLVYGERNRFERARITFSPEQVAADAEVIKHIEQVGWLCGEASLSPEAWEWYQNWWENPAARPPLNKSPLLIHFYTSLNLHLLKIAMALHFGESLDMVIQLDTLLRARQMLEKIERTMHLALDGKADERHENVTMVLGILRDYGTLTDRDMYVNFMKRMSFPDFQVMLSDMAAAGKLARVNGSKYTLTKAQQV